MEVPREDWKTILAPLKTQELQRELEDIDSRIWENPHQTSRGRLEETESKEKIGRWIDSYSEPRVLEIGCGKGYTTQEIKDNFPEAKVHGLDIVDDFVDQPDCIQGTGVKLPFQESSFDLVVAPNSLGLIEYKNIATRAGAKLAKKSDFYHDNIGDLDTDAKSSFNTSARFEGGKAYNELFVEKAIDEAARVLEDEGRFALLDGENYFLAESTGNTWQILEQNASENRYSTWETEMNRYKGTVKTQPQGREEQASRNYVN